jgi:hypothetical protein
MIPGAFPQQELIVQEGMKLASTQGFPSFAAAINAQGLPQGPYAPRPKDPIVLITDVSLDGLN